MQGLGKNAGANTLFYGSVHNSSTDRTLETKLKKAYWETKQTFIQKLGKDQDEHVVASDSDIDIRLEQSRRLEASCHGLSTCIKKYHTTVAELVSNHNNLGYYLDDLSRKEVTSVSKVMSDVGSIEKATAESWSKVCPALRQLSHDLEVFISRGLRDLSDSAKAMERARKEHRAALLWLKKESTKLSNPDNSEQLANFRTSQVRVKETRERFERLKIDMAEKIEMVVVSRCNMLSKSLPTYQNGLLTFFEEASKELHKVVSEIKAMHHPQYKRHSEIQEERSLVEDRAIYQKKEGEESTEQPPQQTDTGCHEPDLLLDLDTMPFFDDQPVQGPPLTHPQPSDANLSSGTAANQQGEPDDPILSLISWSDSIDGKEQSPQPQQASGDAGSIDELKELLKMEPVSMQSQSNEPPGEKQSSAENDSTDWDDFSAFLSDGKETQGSQESSSDWQGELQSLMGGSSSKPVEDPLADFLGDFPTPSKPQIPQTVGSSSVGDLLFSDVADQSATPIQPSKPTNPPDLLQEDSAGTTPSLSDVSFSTESQMPQPLLAAPLQPTSSTGQILPLQLNPAQQGGIIQPNGPTQSGRGASGPTSLPSPYSGTPGMSSVPFTPNPPQMSATPRLPTGQPAPSGPSLAGRPSLAGKVSSAPHSTGAANEDGMYKAWANIFSQLNPLANDKV